MVSVDIPPPSLLEENESSFQGGGIRMRAFSMLYNVMSNKNQI